LVFYPLKDIKNETSTYMSHRRFIDGDRQFHRNGFKP
jgi:hypothetical protein